MSIKTFEQAECGYELAARVPSLFVAPDASTVRGLYTSLRERVLRRIEFDRFSKRLKREVAPKAT